MAAAVSGLGYEGATVVLTGGASGLGEGAARLLGAMGATVHIVDIAEPTVPHASYTRVDLADPTSVDAAVTSLRAIGPIDYLFPIAGIPPHIRGPLDCLLVNYAGTRQFTEEMLPQVKDGGAVGLIASTAARGWQSHLDEHLELSGESDPAKLRAFFEAHPERLRDGYSTSKELLIVWIMQVAPELAQQRRIRINCIAPCPIDTAFMAMTRERLGEGFMNSYPYPLLDRMPTGEEQAWSLLLLSSPLNACVTGSVLFTDQGYAGGLLTGSLQPAQYSPPPKSETEPA
jgi:NAD(P)-dependent dehydrogenase (short-subunit alcohol dehydrogenase family)